MTEELAPGIPDSDQLIPMLLDPQEAGRMTDGETVTPGQLALGHAHKLTDAGYSLAKDGPEF